jgi:transposase
VATKEYRALEAARLQSIKGIGPLTAAAVLATVRDIRRFQSADALKAYLGIYPRRFQSGSCERPARMASHGNRLLRRMIWNCAKTAARHNPVCCDLFARLVAKGKSKPAAYGAVARKLVEIMYAVLKHNADFRVRESLLTERPSTVDGTCCASYDRP